jgi:predicted Zn finger-like uncharacterized protein
MDVTCNRCNTEYEFEEALVSSRGTTVKCTHCGHLFKVQRVANVALAAEAKHWTIRRTDGHTHTLDTLCGLPQLIGDGTFAVTVRLGVTTSCLARAKFGGGSATSTSSMSISSQPIGAARRASNRSGSARRSLHRSLHPPLRSAMLRRHWLQRPACPRFRVRGVAQAPPRL